MDFAEIADLVVPAALTAVGLYLAHGYRRQIRMRIAERRLAAYAALWSRMAVATPVRIADWNVPQPLTAAEREALFRDLAAWYYEAGNGMLLGEGTRSVYLTVKDNLVRPLTHYAPECVAERLRALPPKDQDGARGRLAIRQLSLLRTRMKADLSIYGVPYVSHLDADDRALLVHCGEKLTARPWARTPHTFPLPWRRGREAEASAQRDGGGDE